MAEEKRDTKQEKIWIEKFRPKTYNGVVGQPIAVEIAKAYTDGAKHGDKDLPHFLFTGPPGTGKTTLAKIMCREVMGSAQGDEMLKLNASDARRLDDIRNRVKEHARTMPIGCLYRIIFLDEADRLTPEAQDALRGIMEDFAGTSRFILTCNYESMISDALKSRCTVIHFKPIDWKPIQLLLKKICDDEGIESSLEGLTALAIRVNGDMREGVKLLSMLQKLKHPINEETVEKYTYEAPYTVIGKIFQFITNREMKFQDKVAKVRKYSDELYYNGYDIRDILKKIDMCLDDSKKLPLNIKLQATIRLAETDARLVQGANPYVQLKSFFNWLLIRHEKEMSK